MTVKLSQLPTATLNSATDYVTIVRSPAGSPVDYIVPASVNGQISAGTNITLAGLGTNASPLVINAASSSYVPSTPQGRLYLTTGTPIQTSEQVNKGTIYYGNYAGNLVPYYNGTLDLADAIPSNEVSTAMAASGTGVLNTSGVFDVWWCHNGGSPTIGIATNGSGGGWASDTGGSNTARGTGYSQLDKTTRPYITNKNTLSNVYNGTTNLGPIVANQATYLGTIYTTAAGKTGISLFPSAAAGGSGNVIGVYNAYNRVPVASIERDSTTGWTYTTASWRVADGNNANSISFVDGLGQNSLDVTYANFMGGSVNPNVLIGVNLDSTTAAPTIQSVSFATNNNTNTFWGNPVVSGYFYPVTGFHTLYAMELNSAGTSSYNVDGNNYYLMLRTTY